MRDTILYVEDSGIVREDARRDLHSGLPSYFFLPAADASEAIRLVLDKLEQLAIVCTDGHLSAGTGIALARNLRCMGYSGPIIYTGHGGIPTGYERFFVAHAQKSGAGLVAAIKQHAIKPHLGF